MALVLSSVPLVRVRVIRTANNTLPAGQRIKATPTVRSLSVAGQHGFIDPLEDVLSTLDGQTGVDYLDLVATDDPDVAESFGWTISLVGSARAARIVSVPQTGSIVEQITVPDAQGGGTHQMPAVWLHQLADFTGPSGATGSDLASRTYVDDSIYALQQAPDPFPQYAMDGEGGGSSTPDATTSVKGKAVLLGGTADNPTVPWSSVTGAPTIPAGYTDEQAQDAAGAALTGQSGKVSATYDDGNNHVVLDVQNLTKADVGLNNVNNTADANKPVSTSQQAALDLKANLAALAAVALSGAYGDLSGRPAIPATYGDLSGTVPASALPALAINDTFVVADQAAMLALTAQRGDIAIRQDRITAQQPAVYILGAEGASTLANWILLPVPADAVASVAGRTGAVTLAKSDVGLGSVDNTADVDKPVSAATQTALDAKTAKFTQRSTAATSATTAAANEIVPLDTTGGTFALTGPSSGAPFGARWKAGTTAPTIAAPVGYTIAGAASISMGLAPGGSTGELVVWQAFGTDYQPVGGFKPQSALNAVNDTRYAFTRARTLLPGWAAATDGCVFWQTQRTDITGVTGCNFRAAYTVLGPDLLNTRLVFANFGVQDDPGPNPITVSCTVEQGYSPYRCNVTFNGADSVTITPGGIAISDPIATRVATGGKLALRTFVAVADTAKTIPVNYYQGAGDFRIDTTQTDVRASSTFTSSASHWGHGPVAILTDTPTPDVAVFIGASLTFGVGDFPNHIGWSSRWALRESQPYLKLATPGEKAATFSNLHYSHRRLAIATGGTLAICAHGVNDGYGPPADTSTAKTSMLTIWADLKRRGFKRVFQTTITPATTSTDSWATVANQADDPVRWSTAQLAELNAWIRSKPSAALDGVIDMADIVMSGRDTNRWKGGYSVDGIHPSGAGHLAILDALPTFGVLIDPSAAPLPALVTGLTVTAPTTTSITASWTAAAGATSYRVDHRASGTPTWTTGPTVTATTATVTGLASSTTYEVRVRGINTSGFGAEANATVTLGSAGGGGGSSTYAADSFTRADTSGNPGSTPTSGFTWTPGGSGGTFGINANNIQQQGGVGGNTLCVVDTGQSNGTLTITLVNLTATNRGLMFRGNSDGTGYIFYCASAGYRLRKVTSGTTGTTSTIQDTTSPAPAAGDVLSVVLSGSSITCKVNGTTVITATDSTYSGTRHGPWVAFGANGQRWDDFSHVS